MSVTAEPTIAFRASFSNRNSTDRAAARVGRAAFARNVDVPRTVVFFVWRGVLNMPSWFEIQEVR
jgi:hypothetical protein